MQSQRSSIESPSADPTVLASPSGLPSILGNYRPAPDRFDEFCDPAGQPRPIWAKFHDVVAGFDPGEFARRWEHSQRLIYENGISYSAYGDSKAHARPWELDALPLLIAESEWNSISDAVAQRAQVLQMTLADLLGPQRLIREGVLPPAVLFGHPGFRLPYHGQLPPGDTFLHFYACDLGRAPNGSWWVMADRTEAPSGIGFALENRVVMSRMLPEVFRVCNVRRLAPFFIDFSARLQQLAPTGRDNPRIAVYSGGPKNENYFEDAYLARYLGYTLVHSDDLAVRDNALWIKTLDGLLPVDVMLRRPNSEMCDPLEFGDETNIGVAGLMNSARHSNISIVNPLGSGLVESPVFMAFMPQLCHFFLQQQLLLPGIATWWCGDPVSLEYVLGRLDELFISSAYRGRGRGHGSDQALQRMPTERLRDEILAHPHRYVAQERVKLSTGPTWRAGKTTAANIVLRSFAVSRDGSYGVMPGGLARTSKPQQDGRTAIPTGRGSKDAWILSDKPVEHVSLLSTHDEAVTIRRTGSDLPSRVAENIYWLGREIERADASARLLRTVVLKLTSETADEAGNDSIVMLRTLTFQGQLEPGFTLDDSRYPLSQVESALPRCIYDQQQVGSIRSVIDRMFHFASLVRDRLSIDSWRILVGIDQKCQAPRAIAYTTLTDVLNLANGLIVDLAAIEGMCMESMTRSQVFRFLDIGRRLERAIQTNMLLRCFVLEPAVVNDRLLETLLEIADSLMTYRSRYLANLKLPAVLDLLLTDETNPRSISFQLNALEQEVAQLPRESGAARYLPHERLIRSMAHDVRMADIQQLCDTLSGGNRQPLEELIQRLDRDLPRLSDEIAHRYLVHVGPSRRIFSAPAPGDSP